MSTKKPKQNWRDRLPIHPAAEMLPLMTPEQLQEHANDIAENGLLVPAVLLECIDAGESTVVLLDGRNTLDALALLDCKIFPTKKGEPETIDWCGDLKCKNIDNGRPFRVFEFGHPADPYSYVKSRNIHRRQLTTKQKRDAIEKLLKADPEKSNRQIAKMTGRDDKTVATVRGKLEATAEIPQLKKTRGGDGKARPARKKINDVVLAAIAGTCLDTETERAALAKLPTKKQCELAARAKVGETVTAIKPAKSNDGKAERSTTDPSVEQTANPDAVTSTAKRTTYYAEHEDDGAGGEPADSAKSTDEPAASGEAAPGDGGAEPQETHGSSDSDANSFAVYKVEAAVRALAAVAAPLKNDLLWIVDHLADCPEGECAKLIELLRHVGAEYFAWADRIANGLPEPPKPEKLKQKSDPLFAKINAKLKADARAESTYAKPSQLKFHPTLGGAVYSLHVPGHVDRDRGGLRLADLEQLAKEIGIATPEAEPKQPVKAVETPAPVRDEAAATKPPPVVIKTKPLKKTSKGPELEFSDVPITEDHLIGYEAEVGDAGKHSFRIEPMHPVEPDRWRVKLNPEYEIVAEDCCGRRDAERAAQKYFNRHPKLWPTKAPATAPVEKPKIELPAPTAH